MSVSYTKILFTLFISSLLTACDNNSSYIPSDNKQAEIIAVDVFSQQAKTGRWYTEAQYETGKQVFRKNCVACHKQNAEGTADWKTAGPGGYYPPPPLNGSAHAWHHPLSALLTVIREGGGAYGGVMPAWKSSLTEAEMLSTVAFFQSYWSDEIYQRWLEIEKSARE